jgi:hypothetical protein
VNPAKKIGIEDFKGIMKFGMNLIEKSQKDNNNSPSPIRGGSRGRSSSPSKIVDAHDADGF